ncbi:MAG: hypothetical protein P8J18_00335 [Halieaceae bacterium]|nr:hypothetical protein [Halieaceae bacterium]
MYTKYSHYYFWTVTIMRVVPTYFAFAVVIAMLLYPGGNIHDSSQVGYSLSSNFLSDLGTYAAYSGEVNFFSSLFFNTAMLAFSLVAISFFYTPMLFRSRSLDFRIALLGSACMVIGFLFFCTVGLTPADLYLDAHIFVAINAPRWLAIGGILYWIVLYRSDSKPVYLMAISTFFLLVLAYACYQFFTRDSGIKTLEKLITQATIQKAMVLVMLSSMIVLSFAFSDKINKGNL